MLKRIYAILITLLLFTLLAVPAHADGVVNADGYVYSDGYYLQPSTGTLYTRTAQSWQDWVPGYYTYSNCCRVYVAGYWGPAYTTYKYTPVQVNVNAPDVESQLIALAKARDAGVLRIAAAAQKSASALALATQLGLAGNFNIPNYGAGIFPVANYSGALVTTAGASGNTQYGYSQLTLDVRGIDDTILAQALAQAQADGGLYLDKAHERLAAAEARRVILSSRAYQTAVQGAAAAALATATGKAVQPKTDVRIEQNSKVPVAPVQPAELAPAPAVAFLSLSGPAQCIKCHGEQGAARAKFDITVYNPSTAPDGDIDRVTAYLISTDPKASCGNASGRTKLSVKELSHFLKR